MHKIIILDEADSMTTGAQQALRMIMTEYSSTTRFALACNDSSKIIEPIQSRCSIMRFTRLAEEELLESIQNVIDKEQINYEQKGIEALIYLADGDMRAALNNLQATAAGFPILSYENVFKVCDQPRPETMNKIVLYAYNGDFEQVYIYMHIYIYIYNIFSRLVRI